MADALVSSLVNAIMENLNNLVLGESAILGGLKSDLENLESTLSTIQAVLHDAEQKQWKSVSVKNWLRKLKNAAYDADDVLDEFAIEADRRKLHRDFKNRVRSFFSLENPFVFHAKMAYKLKNVRAKLDTIASEKDKFHLREGIKDTEVVDNSFDWRQTSSLINESEICGRDKEKEELISMLLANSDDFSVYAICGMGGLGKTTLAQLVYNDARVKSHFDLRIWVCVSNDFEMQRLTRAIIESIQGRPCNNKELDPLQQCLQEKLSARKFLLILDDVWNEYPEKWNRLKNALRCGATGSSVIVTTRIEKVALMMATASVQHMVRLSDDDCWWLFEQHAFGMRGRAEYEHLEAIGRGIVKKCGGVPLAIKALGSLLRFKRKQSEWLSVKDGDIWDMPDEGNMILPALKLSYNHMPPHLRQCFSFCSIFPKDYEMKKSQLIELWLANGLVSCRGQMDLHDMGHEIFGELVLRSIFEDVKEDFDGNVTCKMHDLVHDLALSIMQDESCLIEDNKALKVSKGVRHLAIRCNNYVLPIPMNNDLLRFQSLRSFLVLPWTRCDDIRPCFTGPNHLRVLHLDGSSFKKWPKTINKLKHLRYLDFSSSQIKILPESITSLQKLQTLCLRFCQNLCMLPKGMKLMRNLMYLDITYCDSISCMPAGIGQLTCLRKLSMFIVGEDAGHQIGELNRLNLEGKLSIKHIDNVKNLTDAKSANLMSKKNLESLELIWEGRSGNNLTEKIEETINGLQPNSNLKKLRIVGYQGSKFPNWIMDLLIANLVEISLKGCSRCEHLPPLGKLQFLKVLRLSGLHAVKYIDSEAYGDGENSFPSLESLTLGWMDNLEKWAMVAGKESFPRLGKLVVDNCPKLVKVPNIPSVKTLEIREASEMLLSSIQNLTSLTSLHIYICPNMTHLPSGLLQNHKLLEQLCISYLLSLESLSNQLDNLSALKCLGLHSCYKLESLPEGLQHLHSLESLRIRDCSILSFPVLGLHGLASLRILSIAGCHKLTSLSEGMRYLTALENLLVFDCWELNSLPDSIDNLTALRSLEIYHCKGLASLPNRIGNLTSLYRLYIKDCPKLMCLPEGLQNLKSLRELKIKDCPYLERRCKKESGEDWPKIAHIPVICINHQLIQYTPP